MNCLITGSNGFLGRILSISLINNIELSTLSRSKADYSVDLSNEIPVFKKPFNIVIHAAGKAHSVPKIDFEKNEFNQVNIFGTKNLLEGLTKSGVPKYFVFISSVSVYGKDFGIGIDENAALRALDPYGISKIKAEKIVLDWCKQHQVICTILRLPLVVGPNPPGNLGSMINGINKGYYLNVAGGSAKKSMVLASDVAEFVLKASEVGGIYNLTDGYHPTLFELSNTIAKQLGKKPPLGMPFWFAKLIAFFGDLIGEIVPFNSRKLRKMNTSLTFDDSKARLFFGWNPTPVLENLKIKCNNK